MLRALTTWSKQKAGEQCSLIQLVCQSCLLGMKGAWREDWQLLSGSCGDGCSGMLQLLHLGVADASHRSVQAEKRVWDSPEEEQSP